MQWARVRPVGPARLILATLWLAVACLAASGANDPRPVVGPGATKDDVIKAYGWPNGQSQSGNKEILSYAQGEVVLENGRVDRVNFSPDIPWQKPKPRPGPPTASTRKAPEAPTDYWLTNYDAARTEAQRRNARILALFTGSDWSPASRTFHDEVEYDADFINAFAGDFVFLKLDYPRGSPVPAVISEQNLALRDRYGVTTYPTLLVLSASGALLARADLTTALPNQSFRERVIAAVRAVRDATQPASVPAVAPSVPAEKATTMSSSAAPAATLKVVPTTSDGSTGRGVATTPLRGLRSATGLVIMALVAGGILVALVLWLVWRRPREENASSVTEIAGRIDAAAGGLPSPAEIAQWPHGQLCAITAAMTEFDNYTAHIRPEGGDVDIELRKRGDLNPRVLVFCSSGNAGVVTVKPLRELFASLAAEGAENGWVVSPAGFSSDAQDYAASHKILLIGAEGLLNMMREVPPVSLPRVLSAMWG